ncbi:response regulator [Rhodococcoides kroppenstedtii]|uniref:hypothetical protein n=1 Tax=Rhodococcoides kroppenstedtii TaxID=293050 RepID=UPI0036270829
MAHEGSVLLVEDHQAYELQFREIFGDVDRFGSAEDLVESGMKGWPYAFVDFDLDREGTGLGVLEYLREHSPGTRVVIFTSLSENGRALFALAAYHWYGAWAVTEKRSCSDEVLTALGREGRNPTPAGTVKLLREQAWRVDTLFPLPHALGVWRVWVAFGGSAPAIAKAHPYWNRNDLYDFSTDTTAAVSQFRQQCAALLAPPVQMPNGHMSQLSGQNQKVITAFVETHSKFFYAPELDRIVNRVAPWNGAQASDFWGPLRAPREEKRKKRPRR